MFSKLNFLSVLLLTVAVTLSISAQQFTLEATIDKGIIQIVDIDGDGVYEYAVDNENNLYDGASHLLKYTLPGVFVYWFANLIWQNPNSNFPHIDYNADGIRELVVSGDNSFASVIVYDVINDQTLFEFDPPEDRAYFRGLIDIDGDGVLEMILEGFTFGNPNIRKTYIYSTGVITSTLDNPIIHQNSRYQLQQNYPNPFNPSTKIEYSISEPSIVRINIFNINGELIKELINEEKNNGNYSATWNGKDNNGTIVASGTYFYQLQVGDFVQAKKMILLK